MAEDLALRREQIASMLNGTLGARGVIGSGRKRPPPAKQPLEDIGVFPFLTAVFALMGYRVSDVQSVHEGLALPGLPVAGATAGGLGTGSERLLPRCRTYDGRRTTRYRTHRIRLERADIPPLPGHHDHSSVNRTFLYTEFIADAVARHEFDAPNSNATRWRDKDSGSSDDPTTDCLLPPALMDDILREAGKHGGQMAASLRGAEFELFRKTGDQKQVHAFFAEHMQMIVQDDTQVHFAISPGPVLHMPVLAYLQRIAASCCQRRCSFASPPLCGQAPFAMHSARQLQRAWRL